MNAIQIKKYNLIQKITLIDDSSLLQKIQDLLIKSGYFNDEDVQGLPTLLNHKNNEFNDKEDFTDYIKEWVKDM